MWVMAAQYGEPQNERQVRLVQDVKQSGLMVVTRKEHGDWLRLVGDGSKAVTIQCGKGGAGRGLPIPTWKFPPRRARTVRWVIMKATRVASAAKVVGCRENSREQFVS